MPELGAVVEKVRSKNAGPFWLTIDIFCGTADAFERLTGQLSASRIAALYAADPDLVKRFEIPTLNVIKFSLPRPTVQGTREDRDMHGAAWAVILSELEVN